MTQVINNPQKAKREVDIHQKFNHPNILQLFDSGNHIMKRIEDAVGAMYGMSFVEIV